MSKTPKRRGSPWFAFYPDDFDAGTRTMSLAARGAYLSLLSHQFTKGAVPNDDRIICRIIGAFPEEWEEIKEEVRAKFEEVDGELINFRMERERIEREGIRSKRIEAAKAAHGSKWERKLEDPDEDGLSAAQKRSRRLSIARSIATHTEEEWRGLLVFCGKCVKCKNPSDRLVKDHIQPIYQGGSDGIENLQPLCPGCNSSKGADSTDYRPNGWQNCCEAVAKRLAKRLASSSSSPSNSNKERDTARGAPCTIEQAKQSAANSMIPADLAEEWWHSRASTFWEKSDHSQRIIPITEANWQSDLAQWCRQVKDSRNKLNGNGNRPHSNGSKRPDRNIGTTNDPSEYAGL